MRSIFLGLATEFDSGTFPGVAIDTSGRVVEVHKNEAGYKLYARTGQLDQARIAWNDTSSDRDEYTSGTTPACAMNNVGTIVEVHRNEAGKRLYAMVGVISGTAISWGDSDDYDSDGGDPAVAVNDSHIAVTVYREDGTTKLHYRLGRVDRSGKTVEFYDRHHFAYGNKPRVAMNQHNQVIVTWHQSLDVYYRVGTLSSSNPETAVIDWGDEQNLTRGEQASAVALTNEGFVALVHRDDVGVELFQWTGQLDVAGKLVQWDSERVYYDDGEDPCVAAAGNRVVALHRGDALANLYCTTSIITDRANWMRDRLGRLGNVKLRNLVLPASHDSGMYTAGLSVIAKTQELSILGQLEYGIRYFDLRPKFDAGDERIDIHHGGVEGPTLAEVLLDIQAFAAAGGRQELIIIDFSHFEDFGTAGSSLGYDLFVEQVEEALGAYLVKTKPEGVRLSELTLADFVRGGTAILVSVDEDWAVRSPHPGFWVFRNCATWDKRLEEYPYVVADGDLRVFDRYTNTGDYEDMKQDQLAKYDAYDGMCASDPELVCDLFLLSWTLTPWTAVWLESKDCNRHLGNVMAETAVPNQYGEVPNLLYVDYCEFARVTDVALFTNGTPDAD